MNNPGGGHTQGNVERSRTKQPQIVAALGAATALSQGDASASHPKSQECRAPATASRTDLQEESRTIARERCPSIPYKLCRHTATENGLLVTKVDWTKLDEVLALNSGRRAM